MRAKWSDSVLLRGTETDFGEMPEIKKKIELSVRKIGADMYEIVNLNGISKEELTEYYLEQRPNLVRAIESNKMVFRLERLYIGYRGVGSIISRDELEKLLYFLHEFGDRLVWLSRQQNQRRREEDKNK